MKKIITLIFVFMFLVMPVKAYADSTTVEVKVNGEVKKGSTIEILVNVKDVEKFYAASVDFTYDTNQLKVESIVASDFITKYSNDIMELGGETDKNGNTASYSFTFLGEKNGIKGSGTLAIITAQVLNNEKLSIGQDTMKVKLVQRVGDTVENYSYKFNGYNTTNKWNRAAAYITEYFINLFYLSLIERKLRIKEAMLYEARFYKKLIKDEIDMRKFKKTN